MKRRAFLANFSIVLVSVSLSLLLAELGLRLILRPADYLSVEMVEDGVLGAIPSRNTKAGGFDQWGFRNRVVPETADIVVIGDSQTYGNTVAMDDSWPYVLGRLTGQRIYNMALGGYGPNQYFHLLQTRALALKPRTIIVGLSMTDDFENAFLITYGLDHWKYLRELPPQRVNPDIWETSPRPSWHKKIRVWLSRHSVAYQIAAHASVLGNLQGELQVRYATQLDDSAILLRVPEKQIKEAFRPKVLMRTLDQDSESIREGMRITFNLLDQMNEICRQNAIQLLVVVIPTKEMVFSDHLEHNLRLPFSDVLDKVVANERTAREKTFKHLTDSAIRYVDVLPALKHAATVQIYTRSAGDMHPNRNGYRVIAESVFSAMKQQAKEPSVLHGQ